MADVFYCTLFLHSGFINKMKKVMKNVGVELEIFSLVLDHTGIHNYFKMI